MDNAAKLETLKQGIRSIGDNPNTVLQHIKIPFGSLAGR